MPRPVKPLVLAVAAAAALCASAPTVARAQAFLRNIATNATDPFNSADTEPSIAVDPRNPQRIAVVAFSGNWSATQAAPVWRSDDGGETWRKVLQIPQPPGGGSGPGDQKIAFDALGRLFVAELASTSAGLRAFVYRQTTSDPDAPLTAGQGYGNDQPHLSVDSSPASFLPFQGYSPFLNFGLSPEQSSVAVTASDGVSVTTVGIGVRAFPNRTTRSALAADGAAYVVYKTREGLLPAPNARFENAHFRVHRSDDGGLTWNGTGASGVSIHGADQVQTWFTTSFGNSAKGKVARARSSDAWIALGPADGDVYVSYCDLDASGFGQIYLARSTDRGLTWTTNRVTDGTRHSAFPHVAVADNGTVGLLYIDYDDSGAQTLFRHRFARSFDSGATWSDQNLQTMNPALLPNASSGFLWGDYEGLTAVGNQFFGVFTGASIGRTTNQLDPIFFRETALP